MESFEEFIRKCIIILQGIEKKKLKMEEHGGRADKVYKDESISINRYPIKRQISLHIRKPLTLVFF